MEVSEYLRLSEIETGFGALPGDFGCHFAKWCPGGRE